MNRVAGIIVVVLGILLIVAGVTKLAPGLGSVGGVVLFGGLVMIGLSFIKKPDSEGAERKSTPSTLANIFFSPGEVFTDLRRHPRWLVALLVMSLFSAAYSNLFIYRLGAETVGNYMVDKTLQMSMIANNEDAKNQVETGRAQSIDQFKNPVMRVGQAVTGFIWSMIGYGVLAAIFLLFGLAMGGRMNFWQAYAVVVYAAFPVNVLRALLNTLVLFLKDPTDIHPILGQQSLVQDSLNFLVAPAEHPVIYVLLGSISLLGFYWVVMNAIGLKNGGEKVSGSTAWTASISVYVVLILFGMGMAALFPSFFS
jgi:multisubunit Na+/H+ antiporter MnhB subunit